MKKISIILIALFLVLVFAAPHSALADDLSAAAHTEDFSAAQQKILESTGVPIYPGATYTTGDDETATVMWFKSMDSPEKIMDWYKKKLSGWSEIDVNGSRIIYKGPKGMKAGDLSKKPYIWARTTDESGVSKDSEITVRIPK